MSDKKIYKKLPAVHQTTAIKNFFENTVEQLFSEAEVDNIQGYIGSPSSDDIGIKGNYITEPTGTKRFYGLTPTINTINSTTGESENLFFYDELIDTLTIHGVNTRNHNKIFGENYATFLPPIDADKLLNYAEYYWYPAGPSTIDVEGTLSNPIDINSDVLGAKEFTPPNGKTFRNGMIVQFVGKYVIPETLTGIEYIVEGVGDSIMLLPKLDNFSTRFTTMDEEPYDQDIIQLYNPNLRHSKGAITEFEIEEQGIGYIDPIVLIYDDVTNTNTALQYPQYNGSLKAYAEAQGTTIADHTDVRDAYAVWRDTALATTQATANLAGNIVNVDLVSGGSNYSDEVSIRVYDVPVIHNILVDEIEPSGNVSMSATHVLTLDDSYNIKVGQQATFYLDVFGDIQPVVRVVESVIHRDDSQGIKAQITVDQVINVPINKILPQISFKGRGFRAGFKIADMHEVVAQTSTEIKNTQARVGLNPNDPTDYYLIGGLNGFDADLDGDGIGDVPWAEARIRSNPDYVVQQRGAANRNVWSRVNFWYHRDNFIDAGDELPIRDFRAKRPIIEFDRYLELNNHAETNLGSVNAASTEYMFREIEGQISGFTIDGVPVENNTFIFVNESEEIAKYVWRGESIFHAPMIYIDDPTGSGLAIERVYVEDSGRNTGYISEILFSSGGSNYTNPTVIVESDYGEGAEIEAIVDNGVITGFNIINGGVGYYDAGTIRITRIGDPAINPEDTYDGDPAFVPLELAAAESIQVRGGIYNMGKEYVWNGSGWFLGQEKINVNQAPYFNVYDVNGVQMADGNKIFGFATEIPAGEEGMILSPRNDTVLNFPLVYRYFKASSEIVFENYLETTAHEATGHLYYKLLRNPVEYHNYWKIVDEPSLQRIVTSYEVAQPQVDKQFKTFFIGGVPAEKDTVSGYDIEVKVNNIIRTDYSYNPERPGFIEFDVANFSTGDFVEINIHAPNGLIRVDRNSRSQYELPLGWTRNPYNENIETTSQPEYLTHFKNYIERQDGFSGYSLGSNNHNSSAKDPKYATDIVQTNHDILLGTYLLDDMPHNLVDALRFNAQEYIKYKNRIRAEIDKTYKTTSTTGMTTEAVLELILRKVISYKVGKDVFNRTYILPFGDNYQSESFVAGVDQTTFTTELAADLNELENSLLVYVNNELQVIDGDYLITGYNPIVVQFTSALAMNDNVTVKLYDGERDSAQCPPTPSTMGLYPLTQPEIILDTSYQTPIEVIVGHDGSKTPTVGDLRDTLLLEFEKRIYNSAKAEFREANSLPEYNIFTVRSGAFRDTSYTYTEWYDLLRHQYALWTSVSQVDPITNEFFDEADPWTWNYGAADFPAYWKGVYEYLYDTIRPHTHPWEMLGFTEKPMWWDAEYTQYSLDSNGVNIPFLTYDATNERMWDDLEQGIIRQGNRANYTDGLYLVNNPYRRIGLHEVIPVDAEGNLITPYDLLTTGTTLVEKQWVNTDTGVHASTSFPTINQSWSDAAMQTQTFINHDGVNVSFDDSYVYVSGQGIVNHDIDSVTDSITTHTELHGAVIEQQPVSYRIPRTITTQSSSQLITYRANANPSPMIKSKAIAVLVNGLPLYNLDYGTEYVGNPEWHYDMVRKESNLELGHIEADDGLLHYHVAVPQIVGLTEWSTTEHSPVVGWAFDGLPIYGPYGYEDPTDNTSPIVRIRNPWKLKSGTRPTYPGGAYTGEFIEDYEVDSALLVNSLNDQIGFANPYNARYGVTPDSAVPIWHYVVTVDENNEPTFPYHVGGGVNGLGNWAGNYYLKATPMGGLDSVLVTDQGGLYTTAAVTIMGDGVGATATATVQDGKVVEITLTNPGSGYSYATATITGDGVRAKALVVLSTTDNSTNSEMPAPATAIKSYVSDYNTVQSYKDAISGNWKFGDGAPVEQAWKASEGYPFAVAEALLLAKPGRFATIFSDPTKLYRPAIDRRQLLCTLTNQRWNFTDPEQFEVHGDVDANGNYITNIGYTQFINSWLAFQNLDIATDFVTAMRTLNIKLAHRMSGFIDKDTMTVRTDQYSSSGNATSLIVPQENIGVTLHSSPYKSRDFYSGVEIEKTATGYKVRGYDRTHGYFLTTESDKTSSKREKISVGGDPAAYAIWEPNSTYRKGTIVAHQGRFFEAPINITTGTTFDRSRWKALATLPQIGGASATLYQSITQNLLRVNYETEFTDVDAVYDFLINLGRYQAAKGFDFGGYDETVGGVKDWFYTAKQFLLWTTGKWEIGNTLRLSPAAGRLVFEVETGFIAKINRSEREQFSIVGIDGELINPQDCEIIREDNRIEVSPPAGQQIFGLMLFTKEIEHAMVFDNLTEFSDVIYDPVLNQRHTRMKIKAQRTANWDGRFSSQGFIIDGDELLPNLDNMAQSLGRYHELGFIPVEKQIYEASRALFGYAEREYLRELDVLDDEQFDFYKGMIQNKGTSTSLSRIARSGAVVQGNVSIYDEWAIKAGDFGDTDASESVELRIERHELTRDPQMVTLQLPESVTNVLERIDVLDARFTYPEAPVIEISAPQLGGRRATAEAFLGPDNKLSHITVTDPGFGYPESLYARIIASDVVIDNKDTILLGGVAKQISNYTPSLEPVTIDLTDMTVTPPTTRNVVVNPVGGSEITLVQIADAINLQGNITATVNDVDGDGIGKISLHGDDYYVGENTLTIPAGRYIAQYRFPVGSAIDNLEYYTSSEHVSVYLNGLFVDGEQWSYNERRTLSVTPDQVYGDDYSEYSTTVATQGETVFATTLSMDTFSTQDNLRVYVNGVRKYQDEDFSVTQLQPVTVEFFQGLTQLDQVTFRLFDENNTTYNLMFNTVTPIAREDLAVNGDGSYEFIDVYVNDVLVKNHYIEYADGTWLPLFHIIHEDEVTHSGAGIGIQFNDVSRIPREALVLMQVDAGEAQAEQVYVLTPDSTISVVVKPSIAFDADYASQVQGSKINIRVTAPEGIRAVIKSVRSYEVTKDEKYDHVINIDIDDSERFLKKPYGILNNRLWPLTNEVDHTGIIKEGYADVPNAGYVNPKHVNFQSFSLSGLPDLYDSSRIVKPITGDLIHVAKAENNDWNVYKLSEVPSTTSFLYRAETDKINLFTDYSLFNFLDTNQIGEPNTGKYLDYYLSLNNANISDKVVVWNNEEIVQAKQYEITDFKAPRMIEARIAKIKPRSLTNINNISPVYGQRYTGVTITPLDNDVVRVTGRNFTSISEGDYISLVDNVGTVVDNPASATYPAGSTDQVTLDATHVKSIAITNGGAGYEAIPTATFSTGLNVRAAKATVYVEGGIKRIDVDSNDDWGRVTGVELSNHTGVDYELAAEIYDAGIIGYEIVDGGYGYTSIPSVVITGDGTGALAEVISADLDPESGELLRIRVKNAGSGYSLAATTVTITGGGATKAATVIPVIRGKVRVNVLDQGTGFIDVPQVNIYGDGTYNSATAALNASIVDIELTDPGAGYIGTPTITLSGAGTPTTAATFSITMTDGIDDLQNLVAKYGIGNVRVSVLGQVNPDLATRITPALTDAERETISKIRGFLATRHQFTINTVNRIVITNSALTDANVKANLVVTGYRVHVNKDYAAEDGGAQFPVSNVTTTSFEIVRPNTLSADNVGFVHLNKSQLTLDNNEFSVGDIIRVYTPEYNGMFSVTGSNGNNVIIDAKFIPGNTTGEILREGIEIHTAGPHGISPEYAANGKRIAVHFAEPLYYNKVYPISQVQPRVLVINGFWAKGTETQTYYEERTAVLNSSEIYDGTNPDTATNIIRVTDDVRLNEFLATYSSNTNVISPAHITFDGTKAIVSTEALPNDPEVSIGVTVIRQMRRKNNRYPILTTLDHSKASINGSVLNIDSFNNPGAVVNSINRQMELRRSMVGATSDGKLKLKFAMVKDPTKPIRDGYLANEISNYGPYIRDAETISRLSGGLIEADSELVMQEPSELLLDTNFNEGSILVGPTRGLYYLDTSTGVGYYWNTASQSYQPLNGGGTDFSAEPLYSEPTTGLAEPTDIVTSIQNWIASTPEQVSLQPGSIVYTYGSMVNFAGSYYMAIRDITAANNVTFVQDIVINDEIVRQWTAINNPLNAIEEYNNSLVLKTIPGTGTSSQWTRPGQKLNSYDMSKHVSYVVDSESQGANIVIQDMPKYRLKSNSYYAFKIYEAVKHKDGYIYYILIDEVAPPTISYNYNMTVNAYNDFMGLASTDYYYVNEITPTIYSSYEYGPLEQLISNVNDPVVLSRTKSVIELPPVEPATYIGRQIVPEPFAIKYDPEAGSNGNGTDPIYNVLSIPEFYIESDGPTTPAEITSSKPGYDNFLMWVPGLEPGKLEPTAKGPGALSNGFGGTTIVGYGTGYYKSGDDHLGNNYPVTQNYGWNTPMPRLMYNKRFSVYPPQYSNKTTRFFTTDGVEITYDSFKALRSQGIEVEIRDFEPNFVTDVYDENTANTALRPEEIFVACFWTEPHTYVNQLVGWDWKNTDARGYPTPKYDDYEGTVVRVKYIRLTELPSTAMTRKLIPDTGWAGKSWDNKRIDDVLVMDIPEDKIWDQYLINPVSAGTTSNPDEPVTPNTTTGTNVMSAGTALAIDDNVLSGLTPEIAEYDGEYGPILNAGVLNGLTGPCDAVDNPEVVLEDVETCSTANGELTVTSLNNMSPLFIKDNEYNYGYINTRVVGDDPYTVVFDMRSSGYRFGIVIMQSGLTDAKGKSLNYDHTWRTTNPSLVAEYFQKARVIRDTLQNGAQPTQNGSQIGAYGFDLIDGVNYVDPDIDSALGILNSKTLPIEGKPELEDISNGDFAQFNFESITDYYSDAEDALGINGLGFLQARIPCYYGAAVDIFVLHPVDVAATPIINLGVSPVWDIAVKYMRQLPEPEAIIESVCGDADRDSRAFQQGAVFSEWVGDFADAYFGQSTNASETPTSTLPKDRELDNIYFPYQALPRAYEYEEGFAGVTKTDAEGNTWAYDPMRWAMGSQSTVRLDDRIINGLPGVQVLKPFSTVEIKGYFRAPKTGNYQFFARAQDGFWMWMSSGLRSSTGSSNTPANGDGANGGSTYCFSFNDFFTFDGAGNKTGWNTVDIPMLSSYLYVPTLFDAGDFSTWKDYLLFVGRDNNNGMILINWKGETVPYDTNDTMRRTYTQQTNMLQILSRDGLEAGYVPWTLTAAFGTPANVTGFFGHTNINDFIKNTYGCVDASINAFLDTPITTVVSVGTGTITNPDPSRYVGPMYDSFRDVTYWDYTGDGVESNYDSQNDVLIGVGDLRNAGSTSGSGTATSTSSSTMLVGSELVGISDSSDNAYFLTDGYHPEDVTNYDRGNYLVRTGRYTTGETGWTPAPSSIYLEEGEFYFVRIITGAAELGGSFEVKYLTGTTSGRLAFTGRTCTDDAPPAGNDSNVVNGDAPETGDTGTTPTNTGDATINVVRRLGTYTTSRTISLQDNEKGVIVMTAWQAGDSVSTTRGPTISGVNLVREVHSTDSGENHYVGIYYINPTSSSVQINWDIADTPGDKGYKVITVDSPIKPISSNAVNGNSVTVTGADGGILVAAGMKNWTVPATISSISTWNENPYTINWARWGYTDYAANTGAGSKNVYMSNGEVMSAAFFTKGDSPTPSTGITNATATTEETVSSYYSDDSGTSGTGTGSGGGIIGGNFSDKFNTDIR